MAVLVYIHPVIAFTAVVLCLANAYSGISRAMIVRGRGNRFCRFNRSLHVTVGRTFIVLLFVAYPLGLLGIRSVGNPAFSTPHAYFGTLLLLIFGVGAAVGIQVLKGKEKLVSRHGKIMLLGVLLILFQMLGGFSILEGLGII